MPALLRAVLCSALFLTTTESSALSHPADEGADHATEPEPVAIEVAVELRKVTRAELQTTKKKGRVKVTSLSSEQIAALVAQIGGVPVEASVPRCIPTVNVTLYDASDEVVAKLGAFCGDKAGPVKIEMGGQVGSLLPKDRAAFDAALGMKR